MKSIKNKFGLFAIVAIVLITFATCLAIKSFAGVAPATVDYQITATVALTNTPVNGNSLQVNSGSTLNFKVNPNFNTDIPIATNASSTNWTATNLLYALQINGLAPSGISSVGYTNANTVYIQFPIDSASTLYATGTAMVVTYYTNNAISFAHQGNVTVSGQLAITNTGYGLRIATGAANSLFGVANLFGTNTTTFFANTNILPGGTVFITAIPGPGVATNGFCQLSTFTTGTSGGFSVICTNTSSTNLFGYLIINPAP